MTMPVNGHLVIIGDFNERPVSYTYELDLCWCSLFACFSWFLKLSTTIQTNVIIMFVVNSLLMLYQPLDSEIGIGYLHFRSQ